MNNRRWERIVGIFALAGVALAMGQLATWGNPQPTDPLSKITHYYVQNSHQVFLSEFFAVLFGFALLLFAAGVGPILTRTEDRPVLAPLILGAGVLNAVWMMVWAAVNDGLALEAVHASASTLHLFIGLQYSVDGLTGYSMGLIPLFVGLAMVMGRLFPRWIGWLGIVSGTLTLVGDLSLLDPVGPIGGIGNLIFLGQLLFLVWLIVTGISLLIRSPAPARVPEGRGQPQQLPA